ncbi:MAG: hypothetical protein HY826_09255 [Actinobacteria bacterium]|nr:hypothetical protein [Actinomycetota bacterium]
MARKKKVTEPEVEFEPIVEEPDEDNDAEAELDPGELDEDALEEDVLVEDDDFVALDDEFEVLEEDEEEEDDVDGPVRRSVTTDDEDDDDETPAPDDVEADLDTILKDRLVATDDEDEGEEEGPEERGESADRIQPKRADEKLCPACFLLVRQGAPVCPVGDDECPLFR